MEESLKQYLILEYTREYSPPLECRACGNADKILETILHRDKRGERRRRERLIKRALWNRNGIKNKSPYSFKTFRSWSSSNWKHWIPREEVKKKRRGGKGKEEWKEGEGGRSGGAIGSFDTLPKSLLHYLDLDVGFSKQIVQQVSLANRMLRSDATSGCSWTIDSNDLCFPFFFPWTDCAKGRNWMNSNFRIFENFVNIFEKIRLF